MPTKRKRVFRLPDVRFLESPDGTMRDSVMVTEDTCGARQYSAGLFFVRPGTRGHADKHEGQEELYYIFGGRGMVMIDEEEHRIEAGDVVFIPDGAEHYLVNDGSEPLGLFWAMPKRWSDFPEIRRELDTWHAIEPDSGWEDSP